MAYSGYPTPDNLETQTYRCVSIYIPDSVDDVFMSVLLGQIGELTQAWYWTKFGTMTPDEAAFYWAVAMAMTNADGEDCSMVDCDEVANCIDTSASVQQALAQYLQNTSQNGGAGSLTQPLSASTLAGNLIPSNALCTDANKYAMALEVVRTLDRSVNDFLEQVEVITNPAEYATTLVDNAGALGFAASTAAETAAWIQDSLDEVYDAAYTAQSEEDFACAVYCMFNGCDLTFDDIYDAYQSEASIPLPQTNDLVSVLDFLVNVVLSGDKIIVGAFHLLALSLLRWGSSWSNIGSFNIIKTALAAVATSEIPVPAACDCSTLYCYLFDFTVSDCGFFTVNAQNIGDDGTTDRGVYTASGWQSSQGKGGGGVNQAGVVIAKDGIMTNINAVYAKITYSKITTLSNHPIRAGVQDNPETQAWIVNSTLTVEPATDVFFEDSGDVTGQYAKVVAITNYSLAQGAVTIKSLEIHTTNEVTEWSAYQC